MSIKYVEVTGFCPVKNEKEYSISIDYHGDGALENEEYSKGRFDCQYQKLYGCTKVNACPIFKSAKDKQRL